MNDETFKIMCPSPIYQRRLFEQLEQAMDEDFPPECEDCGCPQDECCCEDGDDEPRA